VLRAGTDELMADADARALIEDLMQEVVAGAGASGRNIPPSFVDQMLADTDDMTPYATSMLGDFEARRPLELEAIYERPIAAADRGGCHMVRTEALWRALRFLDTANRAEDDLRPTL
jgi:2-dehydropantoate 2-reductase